MGRKMNPKDLQLRIKYNSLRNSTIHKRCLHEDEFCDKSVSKAHSVQENGILSKLSRNSEVLCIDFSSLPCNDLQLIGKGKASTFTGFCNHHDSLFIPIEESSFSPRNRKQEYLYAYRAFALGYYERYSTYQFFKAQLSQPDLSASKRTDLEWRCDSYEKYLKIIEKFRIVMNINLDKERFNKINTIVLSWPGEYGIAVTSMIAIYKDLNGRTIMDSLENHSPTFFTVFPQGGYTYILLGYFTKDKGKFEELTKQIASLTIEQQKVMVSNMIACKTENFFISPDWWEGLDEKIRRRFLELFNQSEKEKSYNLISCQDFNIFQKPLI